MKYINMKLKEERIEKQVKVIESLYDLSFEMKSTDILNIKKFKLEIDFGQTENSLISAGKLIYNQIEVMRGLSSIHPNVEAYQELCSRLVQVHKQLMQLLKKEFRISNSQINVKTGEIDYIRGI